MTKKTSLIKISDHAHITNERLFIIYSMHIISYSVCIFL